MSDYQKIYDEKKKKQLVLWDDMVIKTFNEKPHEIVENIDIDRIIGILNEIGESKALNHTFMPSGGGLDLTGAKRSTEIGKIELDFGGSTLIVNPESLTFHPIGLNPEWWYFRLNTLPFDASGVYEKLDDDEEDQKEETFKTAADREIEWQMTYYGEELLELEPGEYIDRSFWEIDHLGYDENGYEIPFPKTARIVSRKFNGGDFVIFPKFSVYNRNSATYDARHNKVNDDEFHHYIIKIVEALNKRKD